MDASRAEWPPERGGLNLFGSIAAGAGLLLFTGIIVKAPIVLSLDDPEPSVWRFGFQIVLVMLTVPLAAAAWKAQTFNRTRVLLRIVVIIWVVNALLNLTGSQSALVNGRLWEPRLSQQVGLTLLLAVYAIGQRRATASLK